ncbi:TetR family transcriptional regulator C-terminal domain-containing protein [Endozoicomonas sp. G2_1]|uniref:TetR family transcriptional regulator C-terminal domain-containing protein n=1 Tax=Endozoicomonas sp. G2_1 TaxID=2821091 RepID=UPI001ADC6D53|nr:TetR family transcriptional regulator C-terminal domain-containing protein [Endozoicomonas sp. G2_1]MBO9492267.1 TetR family transcriptional regulator C-terminal domain-containing protein [Endozoicomonas sp. G2_1]
MDEVIEPNNNKPNEPAPKQQNKQEINRLLSQEKIINAAQQEFITHGYKGATVQSIADRAELPKANVLYYFKNKENIYHAVLQKTLDMWDDGIGDIDINDGPRVALEKFINSKIDMSFANPSASKIYAMEIIQGAPQLNEYARTYQRKWVREKAKIFQHWIDNGEMADVDPENLIYLIWSTTQHYADFETQILTIKNQREYEQEDIDKVKSFLLDFILRGCKLK